jgi:oxygen-independent coproporphyrinogen-3 oxidase
MSGVYISYPFCRQKCTYCNFASGVFRTELEVEYRRALLDEIRAHQWAWTPETVYLGGGSPDRIGVQDLAELLAAVPGRPWKEATLEAAPGDVTGENASGWMECGINRVSLGVQSFVAEEIRKIGRKHSPEIVAADVETLRRVGVDRINIDLIAGLPGQTRQSWLESLDWLEKLSVGHVSVYMLEVDEYSRLGRELLAAGNRYGAAEVPESDLIVELYETAVDRLGSFGLRRYEISNFARPGEESLHNLKYWTLEPYTGFGADAHSYDLVTRAENVKTPLEYVERWRQGAPFRAEELPSWPGEERFYVGLRLMEGIVLSPEDRREHRMAIEKFVAAGLLHESDGRLRLTGRGVLLSNEVFQDFLEQ